MIEITFKAYHIDAGFDQRNFLIIWNQFHVGRNQYTEKNVSNEMFSINMRYRKSNNCFYVSPSEIFCQKYAVQKYRRHQQNCIKCYTKGKKVGKKSYYYFPF